MVFTGPRGIEARAVWDEAGRLSGHERTARQECSVGARESCAFLSNLWEAEGIPVAFKTKADRTLRQRP